MVEGNTKRDKRAFRGELNEEERRRKHYASESNKGITFCAQTAVSRQAHKDKLAAVSFQEPRQQLGKVASLTCGPPLIKGTHVHEPQLEPSARLNKCWYFSHKPDRLDRH